MKRITAIFLIAQLLCPFLSYSQSANGEIRFLKNSFTKIISKEAKIEKLADGFQFTEGPVWHKDGYLLFSDIPANKIYKYVPGEGVSVFMENSGYIGTSEENSGQGSNGLTFDKAGNLLICQHGARQLLKADQAGNYTPIARQFQGRRLNSPNDAVVKSDGTVFFTDPPRVLPESDKDPTKELHFNGVFQLKKGSLELIDSTLALPNGLALSPDEDFLYVANYQDNKIQYFRYRFDENGNVANKELFFDASQLEGEGGPDGMKVDKKGNCYFTGPGGIIVVTAKGEHIGTITPPEVPSNLCWGGKDGKTLYMTCRTGLYKVKLKIEGARPMR